LGLFYGRLPDVDRVFFLLQAHSEVGLGVAVLLLYFAYLMLHLLKLLGKVLGGVLKILDFRLLMRLAQGRVKDGLVVLRLQLLEGR
jgi:hypothetical protein